MRSYRLSVLLLLVAITTSADGASFGEVACAVIKDGDIQFMDATDCYHLAIEGRIGKGDYKRLTAFIKQKRRFPENVTIQSPGGDVEEAMAIGRLFRKALLDVSPSGQCNSACALIVFGGAGMSLSDERIGLHRPIYDPKYFAKLSFHEAEDKSRQLDHLVRAYLKEMDVPTAIADKMMAISSSDVFFITTKDYSDQAGSPAAVSEWLSARCRDLKIESDEARDLAKAMAYENYTFLTSFPEDTNGRADALSELREQAMLGGRLPPGYRNYLLEKHKKGLSCQKQAIEEQRRLLLQGM